MRRLDPKGPLFVTKWDKNGGFMRGLGPLSGVPHPPKIESGYGPANDDFTVSNIIETLSLV